MKNDKKKNKSSKTNKKDIEKSKNIEEKIEKKNLSSKDSSSKDESSKDEINNKKLDEELEKERNRELEEKAEKEFLEKIEKELEEEKEENDFFAELEKEEEKYYSEKNKESKILNKLNKELESQRYMSDEDSENDKYPEDQEDPEDPEDPEDDEDREEDNKEPVDDMFFIILNNPFSNNMFDLNYENTEDTENKENIENNENKSENEKINRKNKRKNKEENNQEDENENKKNKLNQENNRLGFFFDQIINDIQNKSNVNKKDKLKKKNSEYDFNHYFKESKILLPINREIKNLNDLIELGETYDPKEKNRYVINLKALNKCVAPLKELNSMIGMKNIKEMIVDLIFFRLQNLEENKEELWHLVIQGTPGSGKTEVAKIIGKLYYGLGITKEDKFIQARRSDLIGKYLGHTAKNTQEFFDKAKGGILFIDEAYSLGNPDNKDSFSKECIDTINQNLTENKDTVVFIAGYKEQLEESFFSYNPGLNRRFKIRMTVDKYNAPELRSIFLKKIEDNKWFILNENCEEQIPVSFFEKNLSYFKYNGGDMENLWHFCKIVHARRIFGKSNDIVKKITKEDLENAFKFYSENEEFKSRDNSIGQYLFNTMYT